MHLVKAAELPVSVSLTCMVDYNLYLFPGWNGVICYFKNLEHVACKPCFIFRPMGLSDSYTGLS